MLDFFTSELVFTLAFVTILIVLLVAIVQYFRIRSSRHKRHEDEGVGAGTRQVTIEREETLAAHDRAADQDGVRR